MVFAFGKRRWLIERLPRSKPVERLRRNERQIWNLRQSALHGSENPEVRSSSLVAQSRHSTFGQDWPLRTQGGQSYHTAR
jgi:hypothetical protein